MTALPLDLPQFLESVVAIVVATSDESLKPEVTRGWGMRVLEGGETIAVSVDRLPSQRTLENLRNHDRIALACIRPNYVARQLKGRCLEVVEPSEADLQAVERHRSFYLETGRVYELPENTLRLHWTDDVVTLHCRIEELFDQSPGPGAGRAL
jgi:hypothetical protein